MEGLARARTPGMYIYMYIGPFWCEAEREREYANMEFTDKTMTLARWIISVEARGIDR